MSPSAYLDVPLRRDTVDRWLVRTSIERAVRSELPYLNGVVLDVGCGHQPYRSLLENPPSRATRVIGVDVPSDTYGGHDLLWDGWRLPVRSAGVDHVLATEVLEHCPDAGQVIGEVARALRPGGRFFFTVPFLWPLHDTPFDEQRFTPFALERMLAAAGFTDISLHAMGGWDASLAQLIGLWAARRPMRAGRRRLATTLAVPIVRLLARRDKAPTVFRDGTMLTGLWGTAVRPAHARSGA